MDEDALKTIIQQVVREELSAFLGSSQYQFQRDAKFYDARNIQVGYTTGTMIGTDGNQKLGFFGATPVVQQSAPVVLTDVIALLKAVGLSK